MPWLRVSLFWLALCAIFIVVNVANIIDRKFPDPDDTLRLVQVRDLLAGQGWLDLHQYRIAPPDGVPMHWSRLVDLPIALVISLLAPLIGNAAAENAALIIVPMLTTGAILLVVARIALQSMARDVLPYCCLALGLSSLLVAQLQPMRIDHHGWQVFTVVLAVLGLMPGRERWGAVLTGSALAAGLAISVELLPIAAAFGAVFALHWLMNSDARWVFVRFMLALTGGLGLLYVTTHGLAEAVNHCDAISPVHLLTFAVLTVFSGAVAAWNPRSVVAVFCLLASVGAAGAATYAGVAPQCLAGPFGSLDPLVRDFWYMNVQEGRPIWELPWYKAAEAPLPGLVALTALVLLIRGSEGETRRWWTDYFLITAACFVTGLMVWRSLAFVGALSALPIGWVAAQLMKRMQNAGGPGGKLLAALAVSIALLPGLPIKIAQHIVPQEPSTIRIAGRAAILVAENPECPIYELRQQFARFEPATVFAPLDISPAVLEATSLSVIATGHHRGAPAMRDVVSAFVGPEAEAHSLIKAYGARYVLLCSNMSEMLLFAHRAPSGFAGDLMSGKVPAWLKPVPLEAPPTVMLWEVVD